jgi:hypothetical protein
MTTIHDDFIERSADIRWPDGFDPLHADLFAHNAVVINAPAKSVWAKLIAASAWDNWYWNAGDVVVNDSSGQLGEDVTFSWTTFGLKIASKVAEFAPYTSLSWYGTAMSRALITPGCSSPGSAMPPMSLWRKSPWATEHNTSP